MSQGRTKEAGRPAPAEEPQPGSTRERILSAAERLFAEQGYGNVSMPVIAKAAGITAGAIYKHFEGKEELFFQVVHSAVAAVHAVPSPGDTSLSLARLIANYTTEHMKRARQLAVEMHYASAKHPKIRRLLRRSLEQNIADIAYVVRAAQASGHGGRNADPEIQASAVMTFLMGLMHMETLLPDKVGDRAWYDFVETQVAGLLGLK
jgi:AcrR family transcriptional regulator